MKKNRREFLKKLGTISLITAAGPLSAYGRIPLKTGDTESNDFLINPVPFGVVNSYFAPYRLYWGDIHAHTGFSDGYGSAHEFYKRAKYCQNLDFAAMSDHGEWMRNINKAFNSARDSTPDIWSRYCRASQIHNHDGHFVTLVGVEWSGKGGHRNVYYRDFKNLPPFPPVNKKTQPSPNALWNFLDQCDVESLTIPHHTSQVGFLTDWSFHHERERLVEIYSEWGNSEDPRSETEQLYCYRRDPDLKRTNKKRFVNYAIHSGLKLGIIAGTDNHQGLAGSCRNDEVRGISLAAEIGINGIVNPGNFARYTEALRKKGVDSLGKYLHLMQNGYTMDHRADNRSEIFRAGGGICAVYSRSLTNPAIWDALWDRRTYGTTGPRPRVKFCVRDLKRPDNYALMGEELETKTRPELLLAIRTVELGLRIREIQILKNAQLSLSIPYTDETDVHDVSLSLIDLSPPGKCVDSYYARIFLEEKINHDGDGIERDRLKELVWTSPVWVTRTSG